MSAQVDMFQAQAEQAQAAKVDRNAREDWPTPRGVCREVIEALFYVYKHPSGDELGPFTWLTGPGDWHIELGPPLRVLDFCAGTGPWASELREWAKRHGIPFHITAVEFHEPHAPFARRWADEVIVGDWTLAFAAGRTYDLIFGNPPFSLVAGSVKRGAESAVPRLVEHAPVVSLLSTSIALSKTETGRAVRRSTPLAHVLELGPISFDGCGADSVPYAMFTWVRGAGSTVSELVRELKASERSPMVIGEGKNRQVIRPGAEPDHMVVAMGLEVVG